MKSKIEKKLDKEFENLNIRPRIYHFLRDMPSFRAVTIADERLTWSGAERVVDQTKNHLYPHLPATQLLRELGLDYDVYGVAICDRRDQFNRQRGRIIAKGRLLKHLKKEAK